MGARTGPPAPDDRRSASRDTGDSTRSRPRRRRTLRAALVVVVAAATGFASVWWLTRQPTPAVVPIDAIVAVRTLAGDGTVGARDGARWRAQFADPFGVAVGPDGSVYVADGGDRPAIRRLSPDGVVSTLAGGDRGFADGHGADARFDTPSALAIDAAGALYVADTGNHAIRRVSPAGEVTTVAGTGEAGFRDGPAGAAQFDGPVGIAVDAAGRVFVADTYNDRVRVVHDGAVRTLAGGAAPGFANGLGVDARFDTPSGLAVDGAGRLLVADSGNDAVREISPSGLVSTMVATGGALFRPVGVAAGAGGVVYVSEDRGRIVDVSPDGSSRVLSGSAAGFRDGEAADARFRQPAGLATAPDGSLVVADAGNALLRRIEWPRPRETVEPPPPPTIAPAFDADAFAERPLLWPVPPMTLPFEIAGTMGEARGGGAERLHAGIDVRAPEGTPVIAVRDGVVTRPVSTFDFGTLNESLRVGPIAYVHIRVGRDRADVLDRARFVPTYDERGRVVRIRVRRGARFAAGDLVGTVNRFNHVHLNVGWPGDEHNPLDFRLVHFVDTVPPTIPPGGVRLYDEQGERLSRVEDGRLVVSGRVQIVVDAWDQVDGNRPSRRLGIYALGYQVLTPDGTPAPGFEEPRETIRFDRLAAGADAAPLIYAPGSGIPFYGGRRTRFLYVVTSTLRDGEARWDALDTTTLEPGDYVVRVSAADAAGNVAVANRDVAVRVVRDHERHEPPKR